LNCICRIQDFAYLNFSLQKLFVIYCLQKYSSLATAPERTSQLSEILGTMGMGCCYLSASTELSSYGCMQKNNGDYLPTFSRSLASNCVLFLRCRIVGFVGVVLNAPSSIKMLSQDCWVWNLAFC